MRHIFQFASIFCILNSYLADSHAIVVDIQNFSIVRNGLLYFSDNFSDGIAPPSSPDPTLNYSVLGTFPNSAESAGRLTLDSANGALTTNATGQKRLNVGALLLTNANSTDFVQGLKIDDTLSLRGTFALIAPTGPLFSAYAITFQDTNLGSTHQTAQLFVQFSTVTHKAAISYILQDRDTGTITSLGGATFAPPVGSD